MAQMGGFHVGNRSNREFSFDTGEDEVGAGKGAFDPAEGKRWVTQYIMSLTVWVGGVLSVHKNVLLVWEKTSDCTMEFSY